MDDPKRIDWGLLLDAVVILLTAGAIIYFSFCLNERVRSSRHYETQAIHSDH